VTEVSAGLLGVGEGVPVAVGSGVSMAVGSGVAVSVAVGLSGPGTPGAGCSALCGALRAVSGAVRSGATTRGARGASAVRGAGGVDVGGGVVGELVGWVATVTDGAGGTAAVTVAGVPPPVVAISITTPSTTDPTAEHPAQTAQSRGVHRYASRIARTVRLAHPGRTVGRCSISCWVTVAILRVVLVIFFCPLSTRAGRPPPLAPFGGGLAGGGVEGRFFA
jgi:hypothetical protein